MVPISPYRLSTLIQAHDFDVKALSYQPEGKGTQNFMASTSRDATTKLWGLTEANEASIIHSHHEHLQFVNAVTFIQPTLSHPVGIVASGGADNMVRLLDVGSREISAVLSGHSSNVCTLSSYGKILISGSWDKSAIVWDAENGSRLFTLNGHEHVVWTVLAISEDTFITGSADKTIKIWKGDKCIKTLSGHEDCVRALVMIDHANRIFASAGNDHGIRIWSMDSGLIHTIDHAHSSYIYTLALLEPNVLASAGEDRCIKIWDLALKSCRQSIPVPATSIWALQAFENGDFACGTNDGYIYIYSNEITRQLFDEALMEIYEEKLRAMTITSGTMESIDSSKISPESVLDAPGNQAGQHIIVEKAGKMEAHQWDGQQWIKIGDVVDSAGNSAKKQFNGVTYDYVFDVDIEDGAPSLKLPYNLSENPYSVAQKFVADNMLQPAFVDQVVDFILKNTGQTATTRQETLFNPHLTQGKTSQPIQEIFLKQPVKITNANLDGIMKKISEFNSDQQTPINLKPVEDLVNTLKAPSSIRKPDGLVAVFDLFSHWPVEKLFPVLDLVRVAILNDSLSLEFVDFIESNCVNPIKTSADNTKANQANILMQLRLLTNSFQSKVLWEKLSAHHRELLKTLRSLSLHILPKDAILPYQALFNYSLSFGKQDQEIPEVSKFLLALLLEKFATLKSTPDAEHAKLLLSSINVCYKKLPKAQLRALLPELETVKSICLPSATQAALLSKAITEYLTH